MPLKYRLPKEEEEAAIQLGQRQGCNFPPRIARHERRKMRHKEEEEGRENVSQNLGNTEKIGMKRNSFSLHRRPIKVLRSGAVANAKIARHLVPANKVSGAIEREDPARLCSKSLRP